MTYRDRTASPPVLYAAEQPRTWIGIRAAERAAGGSSSRPGPSALCARQENDVRITAAVAEQLLIAGFATVTITSVIVTSILAGQIGRS